MLENPTTEVGVTDERGVRLAKVLKAT